MQRDGNRKELLRGPFLYGIVHAVATVIFWRDSPDGILALSVLCGGDGLAEVIGRTVPSRKLPHNRSKVRLGACRSTIFKLKSEKEPCSNLIFAQHMLLPFPELCPKTQPDVIMKDPIESISYLRERLKQHQESNTSISTLMAA